MNQSLAAQDGSNSVKPVSFKETAIASITEFLAFKLGTEEYGIDILGVLNNTVSYCEQAAPWTFGLQGFIQNLTRRSMPIGVFPCCYVE